MTLEANELTDAVTYRENGTIEVRLATVILRDGAEIARSHHLHLVEPGADVSNEDPKVQAIAAALWTPELIDAYRASMDQTAA